MQRVREEERQMIYDQYSKYENEIVSGEVERHDSRYIYVNLVHFQDQSELQRYLLGSKHLRYI